MPSKLEEALERAKYTALPLPREKAEPTTIFAFNEGQLYVVRNPHHCLPDPPIAVTPDSSVDTIEFTKEFAFEAKGIISFLGKLFGIGNAKAELSAKSIRSATVQMSGLSHFTIETGSLIDYLASQPDSPCKRDLLDPEHLTIVAALRATTFTYTFKSESNVIVKLTAPEVQGLFQADVGATVNVTEDGKVIVNSPRFVGVVTWDGGKIRRELDKAKRSSRVLGSTYRKPPTALEDAVEPKVIHAMRAASLRSLSRPPSRKATSKRSRGHV
jgi:hypothetical protein